MSNINQEIYRIKTLFEGKLGDVKPLLNEQSINKDLNNVVITDWLSPDEKYVIFLDELYDLKNKKCYGDIWENTSNLITFLEHTFRVSDLNETIKENVSNTLKKVLITESVTNLTHYKTQIKEYFNLQEDFLDNVWGSAKKWGKGAWERTKKGLSDFGSDVYSGTKKIGSAVLSGDWDEVIALAKKGTLYLARKIRQAIYSEAGMIIDTILIVSGVGKVAQFVVWAIVVALDIYEFSTGDYEHKDDPMWLRIIFFIIDIIGMVTTGSAALTARTAVKAATIGVRTTEEAALAIAKSSTLKKTLQVGSESLGKASEKMTEASLKFGSGKLGSWFKGMMGKMGSFFKFLGENIAKLLSWKTLKAGAKTTAVVGGIGTGIEMYKDYKGSNQNDLAQNLSKSQEDDIIKSMKSQDADFTQFF
jgi:hypothetical protein